MEHKVGEKACQELRQLMINQAQAQTRCNDFARALGLGLGLNMDDPNVKLDLDRGVFIIPDPLKPEEVKSEDKHE